MPRILGYWREWMRGAPDSAPRARERGRCEQAFVAAVICAALAGRDDSAARCALEAAAHEYGALPRSKPLDPSELCDELGMLRHAIWRCVCEQHGDDSERLNFVAALDYTISLAVQATLRGGYGRELDRRRVTSMSSGEHARR
jgi:hypothetical protein